jgi:hypothetical protein
MGGIKQIKCDQCKGKNMQIGRLKKQIETLKEGLPETDILDVEPYIGKLDIMNHMLKDIVAGGDAEALLKHFSGELNNFKTMLEHISGSFKRLENED